VTFISPTFKKGTTNPSTQLSHFRAQKAAARRFANIHIRTRRSGRHQRDRHPDLPAQGPNIMSDRAFIDWSQQVTATKASEVRRWATVIFTDLQGQGYSGTTNAAGVVTVVVPQYRLNNRQRRERVESHSPRPQRDAAGLHDQHRCRAPQFSVPVAAV